jgi:predicted DNA-binding transcriptional regulator YafY
MGTEPGTGRTSPTARALRALEVLQQRPVTSAQELADRLGVSERAARRYVGILREAGVPVTSSRGPYGGYRLGRGTRLPPVSFQQAEALGLVMAVLDSHPAAHDPDDLVGSALGKVIRALPPALGDEAAALRDHAAATPDAAASRPDPRTTSDLVTAVAARRRVRLRYRSEGRRDEWQETVDPWAVVVRFGRWYLLCHSHRAGAVRTYRLDRVREAVTTDETFVPPEGLDPVAALAEHLASGWEHPTRVVFSAPLADVAPSVGPHLGRLEPHERGCVLVGSTRNPTMYAAEWLARVPFDFVVEEGPELRAAVAEVGARFVAAARPAGPGAAQG